MVAGREREVLFTYGMSERDAVAEALEKLRKVLADTDERRQNLLEAIQVCEELYAWLPASLPPSGEE